MWFAHATGPLGTYVRTRWAYIVDLEECSGETNTGGSPLVSLSKDSVEDVMAVSYLDPDMVDLLRSSEVESVCVYFYGR